MNMKKIAVYILLLIPALCCITPVTSAGETEAVRFELIVRQKPQDLDRYFEITRDTLDIYKGMSISSFLVNMMLDIDIEKVDSQAVTFNIHLVTIGANPYNAAKRYKIEYNLPARMENIPGKNGSIYQLLISPRELVTVDKPVCEYEPYSGQFKMDPSANFDLYYIDGSLGDFYWNNIKNYLEADYSRFRKALDINMPGKISFYVFPCSGPTIDWDHRFGYGIDPGRSTICAIYNRDFSSVDVILPNSLTLLRIWGYAPPFLVEGLGGYFDFTQYKIKKLKNEDGLLKLTDLLTSSGYYRADPVAAEICASSFVKYLADTYGIGKFMDWYERADDLSILRSFEEVFENPLDIFEKDWHHYIDTTKLDRRQFDLFAARASALFQTDLQLEYMHKMAEYDTSRVDSVDTWKKLSVVNYQFGRYYDAVESYRRLITLEQPSPVYMQVLGNLYTINGEYDIAEGCLDTVLMLDTTYATAGLLKAKIKAIRGDTAGAIETAENYYNIEQNIAGKIEFMLFLGDMYGARGSHYDSAVAAGYYDDALIWSRDMIPKVQNDYVYYLRAGLALMGSGEYDNAAQFLELAQFAEMRSYYRGVATVNLGRVYDLKGDHERATEYYSEALSIPLSAHDRALCEKYIDEPFRR